MCTLEGSIGGRKEKQDDASYEIRRFGIEWWKIVCLIAMKLLLRATSNMYLTRNNTDPTRAWHLGLEALNLISIRSLQTCFFGTYS